ncbi:PREDICTED: basic leucine zipper 2 [Tarenaya hassleriana]|uniref:basic leucine zipper 2 n=1 Tax=Tarenaya hassleriana TaxID=28532 RepID=UPI00053C7A5E|nr:PREDICTED: basic leucine zipper 2 [Tarenaya hassleriana]
MSKPGQLPPRCPSHKKQQTSNPVSDVFSSSPIESYIGQFQPSPQDSTLKNQPAWLDELLGEKPHGNLMGGPLRRSASDSVVLMGDLIHDLSGFNIEDEESLGIEACGELQSACVYGPNSPRTRNNPAFSNNTIASAFSGYDSQKSHQNLEDNVIGISCQDLTENASGQMGTQNSEMRATKRNPGQRSRVRKLQYIAELERTVAMLQNVEADLSVRVATLLQKRAVLSLENSQLKQQMAILKQDKMIREGEYQSLKKEAQRLKLGLGNLASNNKKLYRANSAPNKATPTHMDWNMFDMTRHNLN